MTDDWWQQIYETAALDMHDSYVQRLLNEFRYLSEEKNKTEGASGASPFGDETS